MNEEEAIFKEIEAFSEAWNCGDAREAASFYTEDGVRVGVGGDVQHGRVELEAAYQRLLHQAMTGATVTQERGAIRMLTPEFAVWQGKMEIKPANGPALKGYVIQVMQKVDGRWLVLEAHPKFFPPPTPGR